MTERHTQGLPADLAAVLRDQSVVVSQDAAVFDLVARWSNAPSATASAELGGTDTLFDMLSARDHAEVASSTTPAAC